MQPTYKTKIGKIYCSDSLEILRTLRKESVDLVMTSPPFGLVRKKDYGNADADDYLEWIKPFAKQFSRIIKKTGSLVKERGIKPHPARFPASLPEYFIRMLTDREDLVVDPFAGSCVTGEVCERLGRKWICVDEVKEYIDGGLLRFETESGGNCDGKDKNVKMSYKISSPGAFWSNSPEGIDKLHEDGGKVRRPGK